MQYRPVGDTGLDVSTLGIGTMRFNDRENAVAIINKEIELGLTYVDIGTAYSYKEFDENAESWVGTALEGHDASKLVLSAKAQPRAGDPQVDKGLGISTRDQMRQCIDSSLKRLKVDRLDFYQLWDLSAQDHFETATVGPDSPLQAMRQAKEEGLVGHLGFTSHGQPDDIIGWLKAIPEFRFVTLYYNFNDRYPERVIEYAKENGIGVCIMGPLRGGLLVGDSPIFAERLPELTGMPVQEIALRFLLGSPGVSTVISGMNDPAHVEQNAAVAGLENPMAPEQRERFIAAFREFSQGEDLCTGCRYCMGKCPEGLPVFMMMGMLQLHEVFHLDSAAESLKQAYNKERFDPTRCTACGQCVEACPQDLPIPERMERMADVMKELAEA